MEAVGGREDLYGMDDERAGGREEEMYQEGIRGDVTKGGWCRRAKFQRSVRGKR